ncbi:immunoglobulin superfamily containing leucine-rich repeat protein 2-like [Thalassophryne amazonica]|uniref:immunoglobulin superfamily containing leucine-rich repeat protein 2-like n=1 Tax=Thalassophryne amazonica TaxID=390379 RepID=UPI001470DC55|nr:immunoglobulin superfamily containing leucine-rich repeat protein 2-like [Thalassophryne amazonica]
MAASKVLFFFMLWITVVFTFVHGCPEVCNCSNKYGQEFADCSYKELTKIPSGVPPSVAHLNVAFNKISVIPFRSFHNVTKVMSLWLSCNMITTIEQGAVAPLANLRDFDISHNNIVHFPWPDLQTLTALQVLKMNHNKMFNLPRDAFSTLKDLSSLHLHNNKFLTIADGTFNGSISLSHLQIYNNPFACTCSLNWLRHWILTTTVSVPVSQLITCATPENLKGEEITNLPESKCTSPKVTIKSELNIQNRTVFEGSALILICKFEGNPKPLVIWNIGSKIHQKEMVLFHSEDDTSESTVDSSSVKHPIKVYSNGTLIISHLRMEDSGNYSCSATNELGKADDLVSVEVLASPKPTQLKETTTASFYTKTYSTSHVIMKKPFLTDPVHLLDLRVVEMMPIAPTSTPGVVFNSKYYDQQPRHLSPPTKCGLTVNTRSVHVFNSSLDDFSQYMSDFGIIALKVSETQAIVRFNPLLVPGYKSANHAPATNTTITTPETFHAVRQDQLLDVPSSIKANGLYLCVTAATKDSALQWARIKEGVDTNLFGGLQPSTNYSLCLTYRGEDCDVQVLFTTRRKAPNMQVIISVSICLLTVSTVPLFLATCFHLVYKYHSKTRQLFLKAKGQCHMERTLTANFSFYTAHTESQRRLDEEEGEMGNEHETKEEDMEETVVAESFTFSQSRGNLNDAESD